MESSREVRLSTLWPTGNQLVQRIGIFIEIWAYLPNLGVLMAANEASLQLHIQQQEI